MAAKQPRMFTIGAIVATVVVVALIVVLIVSLVHKGGNLNPKPSAAQQEHTLKPVELPAVQQCLINQGLLTAKKTATKLDVNEPGHPAVRLTFSANFDSSTSTAKPGRALNNVILSEDVNDLTQLEIYAFDLCIVQPGEKGGNGKGLTKPVPSESLTSL